MAWQRTRDFVSLRPTGQREARERKSRKISSGVPSRGSVSLREPMINDTPAVGKQNQVRWSLPRMANCKH